MFHVYYVLKIKITTYISSNLLRTRRKTFTLQFRLQFAQTAAKQFYALTKHKIKLVPEKKVD